jgi:hypothetical protein
MDEAVGLTVFTRDEAETLRIVEPLHGPFGTHAAELLLFVLMCFGSPVVPY